MDLRISFVFACVLGLTLSAPVAQQTARNFIPNRFELKGELLNDDGSFSRQDPPEEEPSLYDELSKDKDNSLSYQPNGYPSQYGQYGQYRQAYFQQPDVQYGGMGGQNQETSNYDAPKNDQLTNEMPLPLQETDEIAKGESNDREQESQQGYYNQQQQAQPEPGQYQNYASNDQLQEPQQQYYYGQQQMPYQQQQYSYQPQPEAGDDTEGETRDLTNDEPEEENKDDLSSHEDEDDDSAKRDAILKQNIKRFTIPSSLSEKDREGMLGFTKQVYLRGGH